MAQHGRRSDMIASLSSGWSLGGVAHARRDRPEDLLPRGAGGANDRGDVEDSNGGEPVNGALLEAIRHNSRATRQLLAFCRDLSRNSSRRRRPAPTAASGPPSTTSSSRTADTCGGWPAADPPGWTVPTTELDELAASAEEAGQLWERLLSEPTDAAACSSSTTGPWRSEPASSWRRRSTTGTRTGSTSAPPNEPGHRAPGHPAVGYAWATGRIWERTAGR